MLNIVDKYNINKDIIRTKNRKLFKDNLSKLLRTYDSNNEFGFIVSTRITPKDIVSKVQDILNKEDIKYIVEGGRYYNYTPIDNYYIAYITRSFIDTYVYISIYNDYSVINRSKSIWTGINSIFTIRDTKEI